MIKYKISPYQMTWEQALQWCQDNGYEMLERWEVARELDIFKTEFGNSWYWTKTPSYLTKNVGFAFNGFIGCIDSVSADVLCYVIYRR
jgi:hypothetical protein